MTCDSTRFRGTAWLLCLIVAAAVGAGCATGPGPVSGFGSVQSRVALPAVPTAISIAPGGAQAAVLCGNQASIVALPALTAQTVTLPGVGQDLAWRSAAQLAVSAAASDVLWGVAGSPPAASVLSNLAGLAADAGVARVSPGAIAWRGDLAWVALGADGLGGAATLSATLGTSALPYEGGIAGAGRDVAATADGSRIAIGVDTGVVGVDGLTSAISWTAGLSHPATRLTGSPASDVFLACGAAGAGNTVSTLSALSGTLRGTTAVGAGTGDLAISRTGRYAFVAEMASVAVIDLSATSYRVLMRADLDRQPVALALTADGAQLLVACAGATNELQVLEVDLAG